MSIDESADVGGRYVANVVIGTLELENQWKNCLINTETFRNSP